MSRRSRKARAGPRGGGPPRRPASAGTAPAPAALAALGFHRPLAALGLILAAALILQLPAIEKPFFADDYLFLDQVAHGSLTQTLAAPDPIGNFYRPISRQLYFWLLARASAGSAGVFHAANLAVWLAIVALLFAVGRRLAGPRAGLIASALLALHYAADVPVRWASGCQDLLAAAFALGALWLHLAGRRVWAGFALLAALLSKEIVALTPFVAVIATRVKGEPWPISARRAWPLGTAVAAWALLAWSATHARGGAATHLAVTPADATAALAHLLQVAAGIEWYAPLMGGNPRLAPWLVSLALVLAAVAAGGRRGAEPAPGAREAGPAASGRGASDAPPKESARGIAVGIAWALAGAVPVAAVASIWSAYYYLFALCGVALALGTWLAARPRGWALAAVALLGWNSARSSALPAFALVREAWTTASHVNRHYIDRGTHTIQRYLSQLKRARPTLPPRSTLFFSGVPGGVAFQTADGPLVRWAYRDTSLRSYYLNSFDLEKSRRGPLFFFEVRNDSLRDNSADPQLLYRTALGAILSDRPEAARDALIVELGRQPSRNLHYGLAWVELDLGDREGAIRELGEAGVGAEAGPAPQIAAALASIARRDTVGAWRTMRLGVEEHGLDAAAHGLLADLDMVLESDAGGTVMESYAARVLAPSEPISWRRWAMLQARQARYLEAARSLRRYFDLAGARGTNDAEALALAKYMRNRFPVTARALDGLPVP